MLRIVLLDVLVHVRKHSSSPSLCARQQNYCDFPKANGYRSVHTTVTHPSGLKMELQASSTAIGARFPVSFYRHRDSRAWKVARHPLGVPVHCSATRIRLSFGNCFERSQTSSMQYSISAQSTSWLATCLSRWSDRSFFAYKSMTSQELTVPMFYAKRCSFVQISSRARRSSHERIIRMYRHCRHRRSARRRCTPKQREVLQHTHFTRAIWKTHRRRRRSAQR